MNINLFNSIPTLSYLAIALGTCLEGETVLLTASALSAKSLLSFHFVVFAAAIGAFIGDQAVFLLGRYARNPLFRYFPSLEERTRKIRSQIQLHERTLGCTLRFMYGLRTPGLVALGIGRLRWLEFAFLDGLSATIWATAWTIAGQVIIHGITSIFLISDNVQP